MKMQSDIEQVEAIARVSHKRYSQLLSIGTEQHIAGDMVLQWLESMFERHCADWGEVAVGNLMSLQGEWMDYLTAIKIQKGGDK